MCETKRTTVRPWLAGWSAGSPADWAVCAAGRYPGAASPHSVLSHSHYAPCVASLLTSGNASYTHQTCFLHDLNNTLYLL